MKKRFMVLRGLMRAMDIDQEYIAEELDKCRAYVSQRMTAQKPWTLDEMYRILEILRQPAECLHVVFPKYGVDIEPYKYRILPGHDAPGPLKLVRVGGSHA